MSRLQSQSVSAASAGLSVMISTYKNRLREEQILAREAGKACMPSIHETYQQRADTTKEFLEQLEQLQKDQKKRRLN